LDSKYLNCFSEKGKKREKKGKKGKKRECAGGVLGGVTKLPVAKVGCNITLLVYQLSVFAFIFKISILIDIDRT
jgi:hypothetical protein